MLTIRSKLTREQYDELMEDIDSVWDDGVTKFCDKHNTSLNLAMSLYYAAYHIRRLNLEYIEMANYPMELYLYCLQDMFAIAKAQLDELKEGENKNGRSHQVL